MKPLQALIADDESLGRERIANILATRTDVVVAGEAEDGARAVAMLTETRFDLVFLDIQMPFMTGFEVAEAVGVEHMPPVIFVTAFDEYALNAFRVHALDYLLKPFDPAQFHASVDRVISLVADRGDLSERMQNVIEEVASTSPPAKRLMVKGHQSIHFVKVEDVDWIEASGNYITLHAGAATHLMRQTMAGIEKRLSEEQFLRIHRSTIVNMDRIKDLKAMFNGEYQVRLVGGTELTLSRGYRQALKRFE